MFPSPSWSRNLKRPAAWVVESNSTESSASDNYDEFVGVNGPSFNDANYLDYNFLGLNLQDWNPAHHTTILTPKPHLSTAAGKRRAIQNSTIPIDGEQQIQGWWQQHFPEQWASVPSAKDQRHSSKPVVPNPYALEGEASHPKFGLSAKTCVLMPVSASNGLLKFTVLRDLNRGHGTLDTSERRSQLENSLRWDRRLPGHPFANQEQVCPLPQNFGREMKLDPVDAKLFKFYTIAFCSGRTLLPESNSLLRDITPMAEKSQCVMSALLALSATYILDFQPSEQLERVANWHHREAVRLLGEELNKDKTYQPGNEDAVIGTIVLLNQDDTVNWEFRPKEKLPKWYHGNRAAISVLDKTDPGYKYSNPENVQKSAARRHLGSMCAEDAIFASVIAPLKIESKPTRQYLWLLQGDERELLRIGGLIGMCPKLLHIFSQITHLCARLDADPTSKIIPLGARPIERKLATLWQWSDHSPGYANPQELLDACILDEWGKVSGVGLVIALGAESHAAAARIYLQCRFYRKIRSHPDVQKDLDILLRCIERSPNSGDLFTSQAPFFSVCVAGFIATKPRDRKVVADWFEPVVAGSRGNVPPAWSAVQHIWQLYDTAPYQPVFDDSQSIGNRHAWWEEMVIEIIKKEGTLTLT